MNDVSFVGDYIMLNSDRFDIDINWFAPPQASDAVDLVLMQPTVDRDDIAYVVRVFS